MKSVSRAPDEIAETQQNQRFGRCFEAATLARAISKNASDQVRGMVVSGFPDKRIRLSIARALNYKGRMISSRNPPWRITR
jgi:hypothetical protein